MKTRPLVFLIALAGLAGALSLGMSKKPPAQPRAETQTSVTDPETIWVGKSDEAKSCGEKGLDIDSMAGTLQAQGVKVLAKKKLHDGKMRIQTCGIDKGDMNGFLISKRDLEKAETLMFKPVSSTQ